MKRFELVPTVDVAFYIEERGHDAIHRGPIAFGINVIKRPTLAREQGLDYPSIRR